MGGAQSSLGNGAEHGVCGPCFAKAPFARSADPIGSPMPETPVHARRKKFAVEDAMRGQDRNNPVYSSKYSGLEKEVEPKKKESGNLAQIHEGKVSDRLDSGRNLLSNSSDHRSLCRMRRRCCMPSISSWKSLA